MISLDHILARPTQDWQRVSSNSINLGYRNEVYWFRSSLPACANHDARRLLEIAYPLLDSVELWAVDGNKRTLSHTKGGDRLPFDERPIEHLAFAFPLGCEAEQTVYIRVMTTSALQIPLRLWDSDDFSREHSKPEKIHILYFGAMLIMMFYNFFLMLSVRKMIYAYYIFFLASYLAFQGTITGLGFRYLWPDFPVLNDYMIDKPLTCVVIACFLFTASFLGTKDHFPRFYRLMRISVMVFVAWLGISLFLSYSISIRIVTAMIIYGIGVGLYLAVISIMAGVRQARFFAVAWSSFLLGTMILALNKFGLIPSNLFTENAHQMGSVIEALLFSLALADQMNILRKELAVANRNLEKAFKHIEGENLRLEKVVAERTIDLRSKTRDLSTILENLPQGVLVFDAERKVLPSVSQSLKPMLGREQIAGTDVFELLFLTSSLDADAIEQIQSTCEFCFGEDRINFDLNRDRLPDRLHFFKGKSTRFLELGWSPLCSDQDTVEYILLTISDVTDLKILEQESSSLQQKTRILESYVDGSFPRMRSFLVHAQSKIEDIMRMGPIDQDSIHAMFREIHTIKGNARTLRLNELAQQAHGFEMDLSEYREEIEALDLERVQMNLRIIQEKLSALLEFMDSLAEDKRSISVGTQTVSFDGQLWQRFQDSLHSLAAQEKLKPVFAELEYVQAASYFKQLGDAFPAPEGKLAPNIMCDMQAGLYLAEDVASRLHDLVVHLIRNSVDHGIEAPNVRLEKGKAERGLIVLSLGMEGGRLVMRYHDDGGGLDLQKIKQKALEKRLCRNPEAPLSEALSYIFMPGFSTADAISLTSGRGVGMDVVRQEVEALKGSLDWMRKIDQGRMPFDIRITLGISRFFVYVASEKAA
jgi:HPt (histidine-containing phosphotransfer) domain-containing protein/PAS domain-containing protein